MTLLRAPAKVRLRWYIEWLTKHPLYSSFLRQEKDKWEIAPDFTLEDVNELSSEENICETKTNGTN